MANLVEFNEDINHETLSDAIIEAFCEYYQDTDDDDTDYSGTVPVEELDRDTLAKEPSLNAYYEQMADWNWRFGKTPQFSHHVETRFDWGIIDLHMDVQQAVITDVVIFSDALNVELIDLLKETLTGVKYNNGEIKGALAELAKVQPELATQVNDFEEWLVGEMEG